MPDDPNADTEWNDILREKGILPPKKDITEDDIEQLIDKVIDERYRGKALEDRDLDELAELEDEEDDRVLEEYRRKRLAELNAIAAKEIYGTVTQISKTDYQVHVTEASKTVNVVVCLFQSSIPACRVILAHLDAIAAKHRATKFLKIVADQCIQNYPDRNTPTLLIYTNGDLKANLVGVESMGGPRVTQKGLEFVLAQSGAIKLKDGGLFGLGGDGGDNDDEDDDDENRDRPRIIMSRSTRSRNVDGDESD